MNTIKSQTWEIVCKAFKNGCIIVKKEKKEEEKEESEYTKYRKADTG